MENSENSENERSFRPGSLMGSVGVDPSKGVELSHLLQALCRVKNSMKIRRALHKNVEMKKRRVVNKRKAIGLRGIRASRKSEMHHSYSRPRNVMGDGHSHQNGSLSVGKRLKKLQRLIPGGRNMEVDVLFQETAEYILSLKMQVHLLQTLSNFCSSNGAPHSLANNSDHSCS